MENVSEALMMAFGVLIFVLALTVAINSYNRVKGVSDVVLYTKDEMNYYDYQGATGKASENRVVGLETIIPTLYKYYNENYTVLFRKGSYLKDEEGNYTGEFGSNLEPLYVYRTESKYSVGTGLSQKYLWGKKINDSAGTNPYKTSYDELMSYKYSQYFSDGYNLNGSLNGNQNIFSFDLEEETLRHEPWAGLKDETKQNLDYFLNGLIYKRKSDNSEYIDYKKPPLTKDGFIGKYKNKHFVETVGEYSYSSKQADGTEEEQLGSTVSSLVKEKKKRIIIFTLID